MEKDSEKSQFVESFLQSLISQADKNKRSGRLSGSNPSFSVDIKSYSGCNSALVGGLEGQHLPNINNRSNFINENEANHDETIGNSSIVAQSNRKKTMRLGRKQSKSAGVLETSQKLAINSSAQTVEEYTTSAFHGSQDSFTKPSLDGAALGDQIVMLFLLIC